MTLHAGAPLDDPDRIVALRSTGLLDTPPEEPFDFFSRLACKALHAPIALVSLVDANRQFFKSCIGLPEPFATTRQTPVDFSFCRHAVETGKPFLVEDARTHPAVQENPIVSQGVIAYAGIPLITNDGHVLGSLCVIDKTPRTWTPDEIDILTELAAGIMMEIEWRRELNSAKTTATAKDRFLAVLSHELRTPLAPILLCAAMLAHDESLPEHVRDDARLIKRNIELETRLVDDLLDSTRIANGKLRLLLDTVDLHQLVKQCAATCAADAAVKNIAIHLNLHAHSHYARGDAAKLSQVFCNVLKNSIKFTPPLGRIALTTANSAEGQIEIQITDNGIGIEPQYFPTLFDAFDQGDHRTTQSFGGLGLGLAICKGIVDAHDGSIAASSPGKGHGTTLAIVLATSPAITTATAPPAPPKTEPSSLHILLVDDYPDTLSAMTRVLTSFNHRVTTAASMADALHAAAHTKFDLLISDIGLPDGTGIDLLQKLSANAPIRAIALSGYGMESDIENTRHAGFARHLVKPVDLTALRTAIADITANSPAP